MESALKPADGTARQLSRNKVAAGGVWRDNFSRILSREARQRRRACRGRATVFYSGRVDNTRVTLAVAREQIRQTLEHLDEARAGLEATAAGLRLPEREEEFDGPLAGLHELDAVIRCGVHDHLKPLLSSLRGLLRSEAEERP